MSDGSAPRPVAVVTGAGRGIGRATAERLRAAGYRVIGLGRSLADGPDTRRCDVRDEVQVSVVLTEIAEACGGLDVLVTAAGVVSVGDPLGLDADAWDAVLSTNVVGTYLCCKHAALIMRKHGGGRIVTLGSVAGRSYSRTASVAYTASKYAVVGLTRQLAAQLASDRIRVNCVCPSQTRTEMLEAAVPPERLAQIAAAHPMGRLAQPHEIADVIVFLAGDAAMYMTGAIVDVNGGVW